MNLTPLSTGLLTFLGIEVPGLESDRILFRSRPSGFGGPESPVARRRRFVARGPSSLSAVVMALCRKESLLGQRG